MSLQRCPLCNGLGGHLGTCAQESSDSSSAQTRHSLGSENTVRQNRDGYYGGFAASTFGVLFIAPILACTGGGFFFIGFLYYYAFAALVGYPLVAVLAYMSLKRAEPCRRLAKALLWISLIATPLAVMSALALISSPPRLFQ